MIRNCRHTLALLSTILLLASCSRHPHSQEEVPDPPDTLSAGCTLVPPPAAEDLTDVFFTNSQTGYLGGSSYMFRTSDGGASWQTIGQNAAFLFSIGGRGSRATFTNYSPLHFYWDGTTLHGTTHDTEHGTPGFSDVYYASADTVFLTSGRYMWRSVDGGATIDTVHSFIASVLYNSDIHFQDGRRGWLHRDGAVYRTIDGGLSWTLRGSFSEKGGPIQFLNDNLGFFADEWGALYKTTDGGITASPIFLSNNYRFLDFQFLDSQNGFLSYGPYLYRTTDGGASWQKLVTLGGNHLFYALHFTDSRTGWVSGDGGRLLHVQL